MKILSKTIITRNGQITLAKNIRELLNVKEGDYIVLLKEGDRIILAPAELKLRNSGGK